MQRSVVVTIAFSVSILLVLSLFGGFGRKKGTKPELCTILMKPGVKTCVPVVTNQPSMRYTSKLIEAIKKRTGLTPLAENSQLDSEPLDPSEFEPLKDGETPLSVAFNYSQVPSSEQMVQLADQLSKVFFENREIVGDFILTVSKDSYDPNSTFLFVVVSKKKSEVTEITKIVPQSEKIQVYSSFLMKNKKCATCA